MRSKIFRWVVASLITGALVGLPCILKVTLGSDLLMGFFGQIYALLALGASFHIAVSLKEGSGSFSYCLFDCPGTNAKQSQKRAKPVTC
jgi:hypothetical protein